MRLDGLPEIESQSLLEDPFARSAQAKFRYTHHWQAHDLIMWGNACVIHSATWYDSAYLRHMHRTTITGFEIG